MIFNLLENVQAELWINFPTILSNNAKYQNVFHRLFFSLINFSTEVRKKETLNMLRWRKKSPRHCLERVAECQAILWLVHMLIYANVHKVMSTDFGESSSHTLVQSAATDRALLHSEEDSFIAIIIYTQSWQQKVVSTLKAFLFFVWEMPEINSAGNGFF